MASFAIPFAIGAGTSLVSSIFGAKGASKAAKIQSEAGLTEAQRIAQSTVNAKNDLISNATAAQGVLGNVYDDLGARLSPYLSAGEQGITSLAAALAPGGELTEKFAFAPGDLTKEPGYQFQLREGLKNIQNSMAAQGALSTPGSLKSIARFTTGLADTTYGAAFDRAMRTFQLNRDNTLGSLSTLANFGQNATGQAINVGHNYGNQTSANYMRLGGSLADVGMQGDMATAQIMLDRANAQAAGVQGKYNALTGGVKGIGQAGLNAYYGSRPLGSIMTGEGISSPPITLPQSSWPTISAGPPPPVMPYPTRPLTSLNSVWGTMN